MSKSLIKNPLGQICSGTNRHSKRIKKNEEILKDKKSRSWNLFTVLLSKNSRFIEYVCSKNNS